MNILVKRAAILNVILTLLPYMAISQQIKNTQVTVYNDDLGLIRQMQTVDLERGASELKIEKVAARIDPTSVHLTFKKGSGDIEILEQNFLYDLVNPGKIFEKYIGETISYRLESGNEYAGRLLDSDSKNIVLELPDNGLRIVDKNTIVDYEFPSLPEGLILKPTLQWYIQSKKSKKTEAELSYLTSGMSWQAEYILILEEDETNMSLASWISLDNRSGATYENAKMKLIAGKIHRVPSRRRYARYEADQISLAEAPKQRFEERRLFEYHLYELQRDVTIKDREIKQVALFDETAAKGKKFFIFTNSALKNLEENLDVQIMLPNTKANNLGIPLPEGRIRVFQRDIDETLQLAGEDRINHTSKDDTLYVNVGKAFDVKGKHIVKKRDLIKENTEKVSVEITISNKTEKAISTQIKEQLGGDWEIKRASHDYVKYSDLWLIFPVRVPSKRNVMVKYTFVKTWKKTH